MLEADCDVWLLTEVDERTSLPGYAIHATQSRMAARRHWAAVVSRLPMTSSPDPHPASAAAQIGATTYISSILPWKACGSRPPWSGQRHAEKTANAVDDLLLGLRAARSVVWGGDWNHALSGKEYAGSQGGRHAILEALDLLGLDVPTSELPHRIDGLLSIDHIAVPHGWSTSATRLVAEHSDTRLSDHDAYAVDAG